MKDLLKIISAKSLNIIAKNNEEDDDPELKEDKDELERKQKEEEEIQQLEEEEEEGAIIPEDASDDELKNIEENNKDLEDAANINIEDDKEILGITDVQSIPVLDKKKDPSKNIDTDLDLMEKARKKKEKKDTKIKKKDFGEEEFEEEDAQISESTERKKMKEILFNGPSTSGDMGADEYKPMPKPGEEERDIITRLKRLKKRIEKRLKTNEETDEGDTDE